MPHRRRPPRSQFSVTDRSESARLLSGDYDGAQLGRNRITPPSGDHDERQEAGPMFMRRLIMVATVLTAAACGGQPSSSGNGAADRSQTVQLGGPPSGSGTLSADIGDIKPADPATFRKEPGYSPYAGRRYPDRAYFGDEHVHTSWSVDAGGSGTTLGPEEATRFARGEEVTSTSGQPVKLGQPLDWVAVTDHSDGMGVITEIKAGNPEMMADPTIKKWHDMFAGGPVEAKKAVMELVAAQAGKKLPPLIKDPRFAKTVWAKTT